MARKISFKLAAYITTAALVTMLGVPVFLLILKWAVNISDNLGFLEPGLLLKSLVISGTVSAFATLLGTFCGFGLYRFKANIFLFYQRALILPLLVSPYIVGVAWKDSFVSFFKISSIDGELAVILVHTFIFTPLAMLITGSAFASIGSSLEEAALIVTSIKRMIFKIVLPLTRHAILASFVLILIFSLSDFSVPAYFGVRTVTTEIFTQFSAFYNYDVAISQSIILLLLCVTLVLLESKYLSKANFISIGNKGNKIVYYENKSSKTLIHSVAITILIISVLIPFGVLLYNSFFLPGSTFIHAWELLRGTVINSFGLAFSGAILITVVAFCSSYLQVRKNHFLPGLLLLFFFVTPSTVLGLALIYFYNSPATSVIYGTSLIIVIGYLGRYGLIAHKIIGNGLRQIPYSMEESAEIAGISQLKTYTKILIPLLLPSLSTAFVFSFILCIGELGTTMMVYPPGAELMQLKIYTIGSNATQSLINSMSTITLIVTFLLITVLYWVITRMKQRIVL
jgi:iron(III) transport system permease protein